MHVNLKEGRDRIVQNITKDTNNFECVIEFQCLVATITYDNDIGSEIRARLQKGKKCLCLFMHYKIY